MNAFLTQDADSHSSTKQFVEDLVEGEGLHGVGGFSLVCGSAGEPLAVISNRTPNVEGITWIAGQKGETIGLSNAAFADRSWPKVLRGEELLSAAITDDVQQCGSREEFISSLFKLLSVDTLPKRSKDMGWLSYIKELRNSIFIPAIGGEGTDDMSAEDLAAAKSDQHVKVEDHSKSAETGDGQSGSYGTQKQTIVLVDHHGGVTFVERTLFDNTGKATNEGDRDRDFAFQIEGWDKT